jgi:hypothetical protein
LAFDAVRHPSCDCVVSVGEGPVGKVECRIFAKDTKAVYDVKPNYDFAPWEKHSVAESECESGTVACDQKPNNAFHEFELLNLVHFVLDNC